MIEMEVNDVSFKILRTKITIFYPKDKAAGSSKCQNVFTRPKSVTSQMIAILALTDVSLSSTINCTHTGNRILDLPSMKKECYPVECNVQSGSDN
jgi:hypothetical protein